MNQKVEELIDQISDGTVELKDPSFEVLKNLQGKSFGEAIRHNIADLQKVRQRVDVILGDGSRKQFPLFTKEEIKEASELYQKNVIPMGDKLWLPVQDPKAQAAMDERPFLSCLITHLYKVKAIGGFDFRTGVLVKPTTDYITIAESQLDNNWHAVPAVHPIKKESAATSKWRAFLDEATASGDKKMIEIAKNGLKKAQTSAKRSIKNGAKAIE